MQIEFTKGEIAVIDSDYANAARVEILEIYGKSFCRVKLENDTDSNGWDTMIYRLSKV
jgi:hypothetical protein